MSSLVARFHRSIAFNPEGATWRERLASRLRLLAARLDGRFTQVVAIESTPELTPAELDECLAEGRNAITRSVDELLRVKTLEVIMQLQHPGLFRDRSPLDSEHVIELAIEYRP